MGTSAVSAVSIAGQASGKHWQEYPNVRNIIAVIVSRRLASLHELQTVYSYEDAMDLYEVAYINGMNEEKAWQQ